MLRPFLRVLSILPVLSAPSLRAQNAFLEKFALATDRPAVLKELIPGTDDYYYYHALYFQTQGEHGKTAAILKQWEECSSGANGRRDMLKSRSALLSYSKDPAATLAWLKVKLELTFDHQRQTEEARADLPSVLDSAAIAFSVFEKRAIENTESLENVTNTGLYRLPVPVEKWKLSEIRALLKRLTRPDFPGLVGVIHRELIEKGAKFGDFPIHTLLTSDQLAALQKLRPALLNNETFTAAVLTRMRPLDTEDADRDPAVRGAWLERLWAYAATLNPNANPLKANLLYHLLAHDEKQGRLDPKRLLAYLKLPRPVAYVNLRYKEDRDIWRFPAKLDFDPSAFTGTAPIGDDEPLIRRLVIRFLITAGANTDALAQLVSDAWLRGVLAEAKLLSGAEQPQRWVSLLPPEAYQALRDRTDIEFDPASQQSWPLEDVVTLDVWLKNVPSLLVRIYEINTANVHRTGEEVNTGLDLDGLTANHERKIEYLDAPILRSRKTFAFPELSGKRGIWIIEFIGNGKASRALIRKGGLRPIVRQTSAGTAVTVLDEKLQPVPKAFAMIGPKQFTADDKGLILLPLSEKPGPQKVILDDGTGFTALETIELQGEKCDLAAGFHVPRESLLPGAKATLLVRPRLQSNGRPVLLDSLEKIKITVASQTLDGTPATAVFPIEKLAEDKETSVEFAVPDRLRALTFTLTGEIKSALTGAPVQLSAGSGEVEVNTVTSHGQVSDLHLMGSAGQWVLQCLGLNGEPRAGREVTISFLRGEFTKAIELQMKTDATGSIALGPLDGIESIVARQAEGQGRTFPLHTEKTASPAAIHLRAGQPLVIPWSGGGPRPGEVTLVESVAQASLPVRPAGFQPADTSLEGRLPHSLEGCATIPRMLIPVPLPANRYLTWKDLAPGTYTLHLPDNEHIIRVAPGEVIEGHALTPASTLQLTSHRPLAVTGFAEGEAKLPDGKSDAVLIFHIGNISPETRVHILTSRFLPELEAMDSLAAGSFASPSAVSPSWNPSLYLSSRNIGDEYRYVLERRSAARFAGNLLARPGLLLNPWEIAETKMEKEVLEELEKARDSELLPKSAETLAPLEEAKSAGLKNAQQAVQQGIPPTHPDLSFLATPAPALLNLRPNADGHVIIPRAALGDRQYVRVLAIDRESCAVRDFSLPGAALPPRDLRLARQLDPAQHFSRQNRVTVLEQDAPFRFDDALAAQFQAIGHLGAVQQLFFNLTQNPLLNEFSWLLEWPSFDDAKKRSLYSQYACHELHFFLSRKDTKFFDAVVKPYLASKRERTFMDDYLLGTDLTRYLPPWHYHRLNTLERLLLAQRIQTDQPIARRLAEDWINIQPVNRSRDMFLFETALRGRALVVEQGITKGKVAANKRHDVEFDADGEGNGLDPTQPLPSDFVPWAGVTGARHGFYRYAVPVAGVSDLGRRITDPNQERFEKAKAELELELARDPGNTEVRKRLEAVQGESVAYFGNANREIRLRMLNDAGALWESQPAALRAGRELSEEKLKDLQRGNVFLTTRSNGPEMTIQGTPRKQLLSKNAIPNRGPGDPLETGDFDNDGFLPDVAYLARFKKQQSDGTARLFRQQDPTKVWAEQQYYRLPLEAQTAGLVPMNRFWRDYALWDGKSAFVSTNVADAAGTFSEMVLALAVLDLPFSGDYKAGKVDTNDNVLALTPASRLLLFHQDILPAEPDNAGVKLLVSQNFYREGDRYIEQAGEKTDKFVSAEFLTGTVYGCQVVVTNPSSSPQRVDVLFQIPAGALPVKATRRVQSLPVGIEPYRTQTLDFHFYFPEAGKFPHFPVHISRNAKTAASAAAFTFNVVAKPTIHDPASWDYVSQHGTGNEVLSFLKQHNLYFLDLDQMLWRLKDADFFRRAIAHLKSRHHYHGGVWSYAVLHNLQPYLTEYLQESPLSIGCGPVFESELLTVNPVEQRTYQHLEYSPLVNARAHPLGGESRILNDKFRVQWESLLQVLSFRAKLTAEDSLAVAGYLATQDRIEEALAFFAKVDRAAVAEKVQYEYLRAWLAMCQEDTATARLIASAFTRSGGLQPPSPPNKPRGGGLQPPPPSNEPNARNGKSKDEEREVANLPLHWLAKFAALTSQLDELEGKPLAAPDRADRDASQDALADKEPALALTAESNMVTIQFRNVEEVIVNYYPVDLEFLFSASPFVMQNTSRVGSIRPKQSERIMLPAGADKHTWALPAIFHSENVLVEVNGGGLTKSTAVYANALNVQVSENFGQLTVQHDGKPLPKTYVKVFADVNGTPAFYKDGYTDLRGKFDYASLSTDDLNGARRLSILIMSDAHGAVVKEAKPPAR